MAKTARKAPAKKVVADLKAPDPFGPKWDKTAHEPKAAEKAERLWNGGERRRAAELIASNVISEGERDALMNELPGLREIYHNAAR